MGVFILNVLALVAHGDDEVIGCGGVLARHADTGDNVYVVVVSDGVSCREENDKKNRDNALLKSCRILGIKLLHQFDFNDNQLDSYPLLELVRSVDSCISPFNFDCVYTHSRTDLNVDHRVVHDIALTLFRPQPGETVRSIYAFETLSATHWYGPDHAFCPQRFVDVSACWETKIKALEAYDMELRRFPHARSRKAVKALAEFRGSTVGMEKAEAFEIIRILE